MGITGGFAAPVVVTPYATGAVMMKVSHAPAPDVDLSVYVLAAVDGHLATFARIRDLLRGLAVLLGWDNLSVEGMTSFHDTNYVGQGKATAAALDQYDIVFSHIEAPDEASHQADWKTKVESIASLT